jgi:hypothetical protein
MCKAASKADKVIRIICGIGQVIKWSIYCLAATLVILNCPSGKFENLL